jgi:hypothetical protein
MRFDKKDRPLTPRAHFETIVSAQNTVLAVRASRQNMRHLLAENRLLSALVKRKLAETKLLIRLGRRPARQL